MSVVVAAKTMEIARATDPKEGILKAIGDISDYEIFFNQVLIATYIEPEKSKGGLFIPQKSVEESVFQGKAGLVLKKGPSAFNNEELDYMGQNVEPGDWVVIRAGDGWQCTINGVACRVVADTNIRMKIKNPAGVF